MPILYQTTTVTAAGDVITLGSFEDLVVAANVLVGSTELNGVRGANQGNDVQVYGIVSGGNGIYLGTDPTTNNNNVVRVMPGGAVFGTQSAIVLAGGGNTVVNDGNISGGTRGVNISAASGAVVSTITNNGTITAQAGIFGGAEAVVLNYGRIATSEPFTPGYFALQLLSASDTVKNFGTITGDVLLGSGNDLYDGRAGTIDGIIFGGDGTDKLYAGTGDNEIHGDAGSDTLIGGAGRDVLSGGTGTDRVSYTSASAGVTVNLSKPGLNTGDAKGDTYSSIEDLAGSYFNDNLSGNSLNNRVLGSEGDDTLNGGTGNDSLSGGDGNDAFVFNTALNASTNVDSIGDFNVADDVLRIDNAVFTGLATGTLTAAAFKANASGNAGDASDRIIYETDTGKLFFDADGNGAGAKIQFATLDAGLALTNSGFVVI